MNRALRFERLPGLAYDIAVGADGTIWVVGTQPVGQGNDCGILYWNGRNWTDTRGGGVRIAAGPNGICWTVNAAGQVYVHQQGNWTGPLPGGGIDIAVGGGGAVWLLGSHPVGNAGDYAALQWNGRQWVETGGAGMRIAVAPDGTAWLLNSAGEIYVSQRGGWSGPLPGLGSDIGIGGDGSVWLLGTNRVGRGNDSGIFRWNGQNWDDMGGGGVNLSVGPDGTPWVVNSAGEIYHGI